MNRRGFLKSMLMGVVAPAFLPGTGRAWKRSDWLWIQDDPVISESINYQKEFVNAFFFNQPIDLSRVGAFGAWQDLPPIKTYQPIIAKHLSVIDDLHQRGGPAFFLVHRTGAPSNCAENWIQVCLISKPPNVRFVPAQPLSKNSSCHYVAVPAQ